MNHSASCCTTSSGRSCRPVANLSNDASALGGRPGASEPLGSTIVAFKLCSTNPIGFACHPVVTLELDLVLAAGIEDDGRLVRTAPGAVAVAGVAVVPREIGRAHV